MRLLIRVDASKIIGTGHLMRCLSFAEEAVSQGHVVAFAMRYYNNELYDKINKAGCVVYQLPDNKISEKDTSVVSKYDSWLGTTQKYDALQVIDVMRSFNPDWIIVDHYAIDSDWHNIVRIECDKVIVIDDLANRSFNCSLLINQNLGFTRDQYARFLPSDTVCLFGPEFAMLRSEFKTFRPPYVKQLTGKKIETVLINFGGSDPNDCTLSVLRELECSNYARSCKFIVVLGCEYGNSDGLMQFLTSSNLNTEVCVDVQSMAPLMLNADLCIGAGGTSVWERCCLGLPSITLSIAENQKEIVKNLSEKGVLLKAELSSVTNYFDELFRFGGDLILDSLAMKSYDLCDGFGTARILDLLNKYGN